MIVSSNDEDPINKFVDLFNTNQLPPLFNDGAMDPKIPKYYILVHDNQDGSSERSFLLLEFQFYYEVYGNICGIHNAQRSLGNV